MNGTGCGCGRFFAGMAVGLAAGTAIGMTMAQMCIRDSSRSGESSICRNSSSRSWGAALSSRAVQPIHNVCTCLLYTSRCV